MERLTTLDVFPVVSHRQPVSDLLILGFFGFRRSGDAHGDVQGELDNALPGQFCRIFHFWPYRYDVYFV